MKEYSVVAMSQAFLRGFNPHGWKKGCRLRITIHLGARMDRQFIEVLEARDPTGWLPQWEESMAANATYGFIKVHFEDQAMLANFMCWLADWGGERHELQVIGGGQ